VVSKNYLYSGNPDLQSRDFSNQSIDDDDRSILIIRKVKDLIRQISDDGLTTTVQAADSKWPIELVLSPK
jgi:hypothetical protein